MPESLDARAKRVFDQVIDLSGADRAMHVEQSCDGDPGLHARVEALLAAAEKDDEFLREPTVLADSPARPVPGEQPGARIGPYTLVELIGEGGFGSVFLARQTTPVQRDVALKIIKAGMDTKQVIARFEAERQALALMDHPNIARVLEAGATESGRPYFVMELVRGEAVTRYCDRESLTVAQRLELFRDVCAAVQHAHQKGIIHRDLKPSNILVTKADDAPVAKVIDFGIAKATAARLTDQTLTELDQFIGTPEYMSPEQTESGTVDIDTRSDIYSLGVLLYELLTGTTPFDRRRLASCGFDGMLRIIRDEEPRRPSARLWIPPDSSRNPRITIAHDGADDQASSIVQIARRRRSEPAILSRTLRRDLDWIVLKCLEKDRTRRYETAAALTDDIGRYLNDQPVLATPPGAGYRLSKFVRRNRGAVIAGAAVAATVLVAAGVSVAFGLSEGRQRRIAEKAEGVARARADDLEQVARFQEEQLGSIDPQSMGVKLRTDLLAKARAAAAQARRTPQETEAHVAELEQLIAGIDLTGMALTALNENVFQTALAVIDKQLSGQPLVKARLLQSIASTLVKLGSLEAANQPQEQALAIRRRELGAENPDTLNSVGNFGRLLVAQGRLAEAEPYCREAFEKLRSALGEGHRDTLASMNNLAHLLEGQGKQAEAESQLRKALEGFRRLLGDEHPETLTSIANLGLLLYEQGRLADAEPYFREALETRRRVLGDEHRETLVSLNHMGILLWAQGKLAEAEPFSRESLEKHRRILGDEHPNSLSAMSNLGILLRAKGRLVEAEALYREALEKQRRIMGNEHPSTLTTVHNLGFLLQAQGKLSESEVYCREAMDKNRRVLGDEHPDTLISINNMGSVLLAQGKLTEAEPFCREAVEKRRRIRGPEHPDTLISITHMGNLLRSQGKAGDALLLLAPSESATRREFKGGNALRLSRFLNALGRARAAAGEFEAAEENLNEAHAILSASNSATERERMDDLDALVNFYTAWNAAHPNRGFDQRADDWRKKVQARQVSAQTATP